MQKVTDKYSGCVWLCVPFAR